MLFPSFILFEFQGKSKDVMLLGCIGDDFTGSNDLASTLARGGMEMAQYCGGPNEDAEQKIEAGVIALKSRSILNKTAVIQSLQALEW